jgi:hypothetical protein
MSARRTSSRHSALCVGITGHRPNRIPAHAVGRIKRELTKVMVDIEASNPSLRRPMLFSSLAEGADRLAAFIALGQGWPLSALLPFHRSRFEEDFSEPHSIGEFRALLEASSHVEEPSKKAHVGRAAEESYDAVGRRLLALSNIVIAVWDGEGSQGKGGTVELIGQARQIGVPVIWVHASIAQKPQWLSPHSCVERSPCPVGTLRLRNRRMAVR